jgi:molybdopterin-guanine dinucleotide biosynthesis protein A
MTTAAVLGAVLAGGASRRFGAPKALAEVGGVRVVDRVTAALGHVVPQSCIVAIANDAELAHAIGLPYRGDVLDGVGALAGIHAALIWARERGCRGVLAVACDLPFLDARLLALLLERSAAADAVLPESTGPRGVEPLCAYYGTGCIDAIEAAAARGDARLVGFLGDVRLARIPIHVVRSFGDPERLFRNMNTPADHAAAQRHVRTERYEAGEP